MWQAGATLHRGARASQYHGLSCCGAQAPDAQAQQLWLTGPVAPRHVGSSQTRARTGVPCTSRQTPNHCATREAPLSFPCSCPFFPEALIEEAVFSPLYTLASFIKDKVTKYVWVYLWAFSPVLLIYISVFVPVPYCLHYWSFVV